jgi:hypothetical protein
MLHTQSLPTNDARGLSAPPGTRALGQAPAPCRKIKEGHTYGSALPLPLPFAALR